MSLALGADFTGLAQIDEAESLGNEIAALSAQIDAPFARLSSDAHPFPRRARIESHSPGEPIGAGSEAGSPSPAVVEFADESQL